MVVSNHKLIHDSTHTPLLCSSFLLFGHLSTKAHHIFSLFRPGFSIVQRLIAATGEVSHSMAPGSHCLACHLLSGEWSPWLVSCTADLLEISWIVTSTECNQSLLSVLFMGPVYTGAIAPVLPDEDLLLVSDIGLFCELKWNLIMAHLVIVDRRSHQVLQGWLSSQ